MNRRMKLPVVALAVVLIFNPFCFGDTFTNSRTKEVLHGYATSVVEDGKTVVRTKEKGQVKLNLAWWQVDSDPLGRNDKVEVLVLDAPIMTQIETEALEKALPEAADRGPLFILLEIDTPGGRIDLAQRICRTITKTRNCRIICFIKGGEYGGAISAGAAVALACDKIYMANNTIIGAATLINISKKGPEGLKKAFGEDVGEKLSSAWRAYLASLAEQNDRPAILARAMVDKNLKVVEVSQNNKKVFIEPANKRPNQKILHTWSKKGSLLTMTTAEAVKCNIADKAVDLREQLLRDLDAADAEVVINKAVQDARGKLKRATGQFNRIRKSIDLKVKELGYPMPRAKVLRLIRDIRKNFRTLIKLAKEFPDLNLNIQILEEELNSIEATYKGMKINTRARRRR